MPKITQVEPQKTLRLRSGRRFNVFLDGTFAFGADEDLVVNRRLVVGKKLNSSDVEQIMKEVEVGKLMERMYRLFNIRQRSEKEIRDYLKNLSYIRKIKNREEIGSFIVDTIVARLKELKLVNDLDFAKNWVESRSKKKGKRVIKMELFQKGISRDVIEEALEGINEGNEEVVATKLLEKKMRIWKNLTEVEFKKKAYEFLMRRGFEYSQVKSIVENTLREKYNIPV